MPFRPRLIFALALTYLAVFAYCSLAQATAAHGRTCKPVSQRSEEVGCWILADDRVGTLTQSSVYWALDEYPTRVAAQKAKGRRSTVLEALGKVWLLSIEDRKSEAAQRMRVAEIGPLVVIPGRNYSAEYMEAIFTPGMTAPEHTHSGPEAWYTVTGDTCLESSDGRVQVGRAGAAPVIVPAGLAMHLTATGTEKRRSLVLILHPTALAATTPVHDWTAKGLCKPVVRSGSR